MISTQLFGTPVRIKPAVFGDLVVVWAITSWLGHDGHPQRTIIHSLLVGFFAMVLLAIADLGHAAAHIFSARRAGAPVDQLLVTAGMPRTLYPDRPVPAKAHRMRAIGGPIFNAVGLLLSLMVYQLVPTRTVVAELAGWSALGHGLLLVASLLPLPMVDGGALVKWTLVGRGLTEAQADEIIRRLDWGLAIAAAVAGIWLLATGRWIAGVALAGAAGLLVAIASGRLR